MAFTNFLENAVIDHVFRNDPYVAPASVYVGLFTAAPGEAGGGTEVAGGSYAREEISFGAPVDGEAQNDVAVEFATATADWGTITHCAVFDASVAGNMLAYGALTQPRVVEDGDTLTMPVGNVVLTLD